MANKVTVVQFGGSPEILDGVSTIKDIMEELEIEEGTSVTINGASASKSSSVSDYAFVSFGKKVAGGLN